MSRKSNKEKLLEFLKENEPKLKQEFPGLLNISFDETNEKVVLTFSQNSAAPVLNYPFLKTINTNFNTPVEVIIEETRYVVANKIVEEKLEKQEVFIDVKQQLPKEVNNPVLNKTSASPEALENWKKRHKSVKVGG